MNDSSTEFNRLVISRDPVSKSFTSVQSTDLVATEAPLEIRVENKSVAVVMRTPGHDAELAAGFLLSENIVSHVDDFFELSQCPSIQSSAEEYNAIDVSLRNPDQANLNQLTRHVFSASSCGICGKATIDSVFQSFPPIANDSFTITPERLLSLPEKLRSAQETFAQTGGLHASALFTSEGTPVLIREDVGRHNALDKVLGRALLHNLLPLSQHILLVSGRISFELAQKALAAGIPMIAGISAPSSLAVNLCQESNQTLVGFLRNHSLNVYSASHRIAPPA
ncbi:MAG: formate dehydrogenase accessory sulfurtransferase FdhD [Verrucomicrobiota bacterium]